MPIALPDPFPDCFATIAMIARWKPVHNGHAAVLRALARRADRLVVGIGSSNRYDARNPFTPRETEAMLREVLSDDPSARSANAVEVVDVPDVDDGPRWRAMVCSLLGPVELFVTANPYVRTLLLEDYAIAHPSWLVPPAERVAIDGTMTRLALAERTDRWRTFVPDPVAHLLESHGLVERFRREFGAEVLKARP